MYFGIQVLPWKDISHPTIQSTGKVIKKSVFYAKKHAGSIKIIAAAQHGRAGIFTSFSEKITEYEE